MKLFGDNIVILRFMWIVGCCIVFLMGVVGVFVVIGNNFFSKIVFNMF